MILMHFQLCFSEWICSDHLVLCRARFWSAVQFSLIEDNPFLNKSQPNFDPDESSRISLRRTFCSLSYFAWFFSYDLRMCKNGIKIYFLRVNWIWSGDQSKDKMSKDIHVELERLVYFASSNIHFLKYVIFFHNLIKSPEPLSSILGFICNNSVSRPEP